MKRFTLLTALIGALFAVWQAGSTAAAAEPQTVRDAMWMWGHYEGSYNGAWGLPGDSPITPVEGARSMGVPNVIMIRYSGKPKPPFDEYSLPFRALKKVMWSVTGAGGVTSKTERDSVFALAEKMPNITGVFMDDFLHYRAQRDPPQWLAENNVRFPVLLTLTMPSPAAVDRLELVQSAWRTGDYRSGRFAVELSTDKKNFKQVAQGTMPNAPGAGAKVALPKTNVRAVRIRILGTHDTKKAKSCGLSRLRLWQGDKRLALKDVVVEASSQYPGHPAGNVLVDEAVENDRPVKPVPAALSVEQLRQLRKRLSVNGRKLDLGVVVYTHQLDRRIIPHLKHCDIVSLWTWRAAELANLEKNFASLQTLVPGKRILLGLYMWDFGTKKPMPVDLMKKQCELALTWLRQGRIDGMIFLATNICGLDLETVNWTRRWIAKVGDQPLGAPDRQTRASGFQATELPVVIPHPQAMARAGKEDIVLGENGRTVTEIVLAEREGFFGEAGDLIQRSLKQRGFAEKSDSAATKVVITGKSMTTEKTSGPQADVLSVTPAEKAALGKSDQAYVIRMKPGEESVIWIVGASPLGAYYGATTLVQLIETHRPSRAAVGNITVHDYPDMPYRMCADWVLNADWDANCYDWGDGLDAFIARSKRKIDMCSRYKVNMVRFLGGRIAPGPDYMKQRYAMIERFALELNRYARRKGVALQYSSVSWGRDYCGAGTVAPGPWILNREHYPDGKVYPCLGRTVGSCLSNDRLTQAIVRRNRRLVEEIEPGSIYLHHIDVASYAHLLAAWKKRCPRCRRRYPDDEPFSPTGFAGAVANLYNTITAELKSVKNRTSGYDAARDLRIVFASPGYSHAPQSDTDWEKDLKYFQEIGRQVKEKENVHLTFREQFKRVDNKGLRTEEMARCLAEVGWPHGVFMFAIQGAGFWVDNHMLVASPVLTEIYRGANVMYNFNGHVHSEVQVLANVNYAWNHHAPGWVDPMPFAGRALQAEASQYASGLKHSDYIYGRFLSAACVKLYGEKAAPYMAQMFRLEREKGPLWPVLTAMQKYWKNSKYDWAAQAERNRRAKVLVDKALAVCRPEAKEDLDWLSKCLEVGARICDFYHLVYHRKLPGAEIDAKANELLAWLDKNFQFQKTEPDGGDPAIWKSLVTRAGRH